jgi:hypothetical protein
MSKVYKFYDTVEFKPVSVESGHQIKDFTTPGMLLPGNNPPATAASPQVPLIIKIAASHAGIITRNNGFYLPDRMKKGVASFTAQYNKPVQLHHNSDADPVGRIIRAEYVDTSTKAQELINNSLRRDSVIRNKNRESYINDFVDGKLSYIDSVNFVCDYLNRRDTSVLEDPNYDGLGYALITAQISDPEAIQKVMDGRYLTGSVGVSTNRAVCSICKQDWTGEDGPCDHRPGRMYDGVKAFIITGDLTYDEYSFVNTPADRHSKVLSIGQDSVGELVDTNLNSDKISDTANLDNLAPKIKDSQEEHKEMADKKEDTTDTKQVISDKFTILNAEEKASVIQALDKTKVYDSVEDGEVAEELLLDKASIVKAFALTDKTELLAALTAIRPMLDSSSIESALATEPKSGDELYDALNAAEWNDYSELEDEEIAAWLAEHPEFQIAHMSLPLDV